MKKLFLIAVLAGSCWWYFIGGRTISEAHVNEFYQDLEIATLNRDPGSLCSLLHNDFESTGNLRIGGQRTASTQNKTQTCEAYGSMYENFAMLGEKMGGILHLDSHYSINNIQIDSDNKVAIVDFSSSLDVAGSIMNIRSRSKDTLVRRNGKTLMLRSEGNASIGSGG